MKKRMPRQRAKEKIEEFFRQKEFDSIGVRKTKRLAMKYNLKLGNHRKRFCRGCLSQLKGQTRVTKCYKTILCENCGERNRFRLS